MRGQIRRLRISGNVTRCRGPLEGVLKCEKSGLLWVLELRRGNWRSGLVQSLNLAEYVDMAKGGRKARYELECEDGSQGATLALRYSGSVT